MAAVAEILLKKLKVSERANMTEEQQKASKHEKVLYVHKNSHKLKKIANKHGNNIISPAR